MDNLKYILDITLISLFVSCSSKVEEPKPELKYTVWTGSAAFAVGYNTDNYTKKDGMIIFIDKDGQKMSVPVSKIYKIDENN